MPGKAGVICCREMYASLWILVEWDALQEFLMREIYWSSWLCYISRANAENGVRALLRMLHRMFVLTNTLPAI